MIKKLKQRAKQRRRILNESIITYGRLRLRGKELDSVDKKHRIRTREIGMLEDRYSLFANFINNELYRLEKTGDI